MSQYIVDPVALRRFPRLCTQVHGKTVSLTGKPIEYKKAIEKGNPQAETFTAPPATDAELAILFEQGNKYIKKAPASSATPPAKQ